MNNAAMIIGDRLRAPAKKRNSPRATSKSVPALRCTFPVSRTPHCSGPSNTGEAARVSDAHSIKLFYDAKSARIAESPKRKSSDDIRLGSMGKDARFLKQGFAACWQGG